MQTEQKNQYEQIAAQVNRVRQIYSRIGEPLPVDVIIDLYRHLAPALEAGADRKVRRKRRKEA